MKSVVSEIVLAGYSLVVEPHQNALAVDDGSVGIRCTNGKADFHITVSIARVDEALGLVLSLIKTQANAAS